LHITSRPFLQCRAQLTDAGRTIISRDTDILQLRTEIDKANADLQHVVDQATRDADALAATHLLQVAAAEKQWRSVLSFHRISALLTEGELRTHLEKVQQELLSSDENLTKTADERNQLHEQVLSLTAELREAFQTKERVVAEFELASKVK
jgi:hypothetical protein